MAAIFKAYLAQPGGPEGRDSFALTVGVESDDSAVLARRVRQAPSGVSLSRCGRDEPFTLNAGQRAVLVCWGVMPSGMLRHPLFVGWLA